MTLQRIEEFEHRRDEARSDSKRRIGARRHRGAARDSQQCLALSGGVRRRLGMRLTQPIEQPLVQLAARHEIRKNDHASTLGHPVLDRADQMSGGRARGNDYQAIAGIERRAIGGGADECASED